MRCNVPVARKLRKTSTDAEKRLWSVLRNRQLFDCKFRRQHPVGPYVADFACIERGLIVEADGGQHNGHSGDMARAKWLEQEGWRVLCFWNNDILENTEAIQETIFAALQKRVQL